MACKTSSKPTDSTATIGFEAKLWLTADKEGGQFYTPSCVVRSLVEKLAPYKGHIYDPACGSGGMLVQSEQFVESHGGKLGNVSIYGQVSNAITRRLAVMNFPNLVDCMVALPGQLFRKFGMN